MNFNTTILFTTQMVSFALIFYRYVDLYVKPQNRHIKALNQINESMKRNPNSLVGVDSILATEQYKLELGNGTLAALGNFATISGLLGTVIGMVKAFGSANQVASQEQKSRILADGIAESLFCTGYGLLVAIPALVAYAIYSNRANVLMDRLNKDAMKAYLKIVSLKYK